MRHFCFHLAKTFLSLPFTGIDFNITLEPVTHPSVLTNNLASCQRPDIGLATLTLIHGTRLVESSPGLDSTVFERGDPLRETTNTPTTALSFSLAGGQTKLMTNCLNTGRWNNDCNQNQAQHRSVLILTWNQTWRNSSLKMHGHRGLAGTLHTPPSPKYCFQFWINPVTQLILWLGNKKCTGTPDSRNCLIIEQAWLQANASQRAMSDTEMCSKWNKQGSVQAGHCLWWMPCQILPKTIRLRQRTFLDIETEVKTCSWAVLRLSSACSRENTRDPRTPTEIA